MRSGDLFFVKGSQKDRLQLQPREKEMFWQTRSFKFEERDVTGCLASSGKVSRFAHFTRQVLRVAELGAELPERPLRLPIVLLLLLKLLPIVKA